MSALLLRRHSVLPGFNLALGFSVFCVCLVVLVPLSAAFLKTFTLTWAEFIAATTRPRVLASYRLTFALPTAVAGIALTAIYAQNGWTGQWLPFKVSFTPLGVWVALVFIGLPFVVHTLQPVLEGVNRELEEAAATLGANRWQTFRLVVFPVLMPALLTGFALAFARALGEYGSVIFIAGNTPMVSEITPLLIITKLAQYDHAGATAIAVVMSCISFVMLLVINALQAWARKRQGGV